MIRRLPSALLIALALLVCFATAGSAIRRAQSAAAPQEFPLSAAAAIAHGKRDEAARLANARGAADAAAAAVLAQLAAARGQYKEAQALLEPIATREPAGEAALELALLYRSIGRSADAQPLLNAVFRAGQTASEPYALFRAGRAAHALNRPRDANVFFREAERAGAHKAIVETAWGRLFLEKYNSPEALKSFEAAIEIDPEWAPAHAGLARVLENEDPPKAAMAAARALAIDPDLADARLLLAGLHLDDDRDKEARAEIDKVLAFNPSHLDAHAMLAAVAYVKDDKAAYDRQVATVLAINPAYGEVYRLAGQHAASHYRFDEAAALAEKALALDPSNSRAAADLGMHLLRTGDETGARRALERSWKADPFDVVTFNLLKMLDNLEQFVAVKEGDIVLKMHRDESPVLREYAMPLAQDALKTLSAKYGVTPAGPILVEIFPDHDDFAVRNLGLPGMIGALGACFGRVVTMDSPRARDPGTFSWQATLWHEMAHVVTLQLSKQRIPRWLTEGISVHEEAKKRAEWGRDMEVTFARAMDRNKVLKLRDLNSGFTRPDTIALAYYQASLLVDHIVATKGQGALNALVKSYAGGIDNDAALQRALGVNIDTLQVSFDNALEDRFGAMRRALHDPGAPKTPAGVAVLEKPAERSSIDTLKAAAAARPDSFVAQLALGKALAAGGDAAAYAPLQRAAVLAPTAIGPESPHAVMAQLAEKLNDRPRAIKEYEAVLAADHTNVDAARKLVDLAAAAGDDRALNLGLERVVALDPFDAAAHTGAGRLAMKRKDHAIAMREFRAALQTGAADKAAAHCDLGESYLLAGMRAEAKKEALAALEIAPSYERAQELLLNAVGGQSGSRQ
ncbi:MAG TPA: tetratricopeptide repeat protein [Vicinamibacterales bacterium]|nr:tetratricopeptide repeat protein [Vicinamibacterales bacterium]